MDSFNSNSLSVHIDHRSQKVTVPVDWDVEYKDCIAEAE